MFNFSNIPEYILDEAVKEALSNQLLTGGYGKSPYNFRCPICGDSKKNKYLKRGYILKNRDVWVYVCHNECGTMSFLNFLEKYYFDIYKKVIIYGFSKSNKNNNNFITNNINNIGFVEPIEGKYIFKENELVSIFDPHPIARKALNWVLSRRIRKDVYSKWFVCLPGENFFDRDENGNICYNEFGLPKGNEYKNRIIIPYYRFGGNWYQFDARAIDKNTLIRYKNLKNREREPYNIDWLDVTRPFFLLEGAINSTFIENSVAFGGTNHFESFLEKYKYIKDFSYNGTVIWDNDDAGKYKLPVSIKYGFKWFNWKNIKPSKEFRYNEDGTIREINDINDLVLYSNIVDFDENGFIKYESLLPFIESPDGGIVKVILLYGDLEKQKKEKQKAIMKKLNDIRKSKEKLKLHWI